MDSLALIPGNFYHIYNRGNNGQDIFFENENYIFFLIDTTDIFRLFVKR